MYNKTVVDVENNVEAPAMVLERNMKMIAVSPRNLIFEK